MNRFSRAIRARGVCCAFDEQLINRILIYRIQAVVVNDGEAFTGFNDLGASTGGSRRWYRQNASERRLLL